MANKDACILHGDELREVQLSLVEIKTILIEMKEYREKREMKESEDEKERKLKEKEYEKEKKEIDNRLLVIETQKKTMIGVAGVIGAITSFLANKFWH